MHSCDMTVLLPNISKAKMGKTCSDFKHINRKCTRQNKTMTADFLLC